MDSEFNRFTEEDASDGRDTFSAHRRSRSLKGRVCGHQSAVFLVLGAITMTLLVIMVLVIFGQQGRRFNELESSVTSQGSSVTQFSAQVQGQIQESGSSLDRRLAEIKNSISSLNSFVDVYTMQTGQQMKDFGSQKEKMVELEKTVSSMSSSVSTLTSKLQDKLQNIGSQQDCGLAPLEKLMANLRTSFFQLTANLQDSVTQQEKKLTDIQASILDLSKSVTALTSSHEIQTKASESRGVELSGLRESVDSLNSSVMDLSSRFQLQEDHFLKSLSDLKVDLESSIKVQPAGSGKAAEVCKADWTQHLSRCYLFSTVALGWHEARDYCSERGGALLILEDEEDWTFLTPKVESKSFWVGLTDEHTGQWRWVDGTPYTVVKSQWNPEQPDDWTDHGLGGGEDCAHLATTGKLNDNHCSVKMKFICKTKLS